MAEQLILNKKTRNKLQEERAKLLLELYQKRQEYITLNSYINKIETTMKFIDDNLAFWVMNDLNKFDEAQFFKKKIEDRRVGLWNQKKKTTMKNY
ncbi:MAG: hypothetical protein IH934_04810 [Nanoarchaeota archaeon]|nr:hypothetical protein [Nanoarchaeota archaeon]